MKKTIAILLVAILAVSSVFAAFSGEAKVGFGGNLDNGNFGFIDQSANVKFDVVLATATAEQIADGDVYASIKATFGLKVTTGEKKYGGDDPFFSLANETNNGLTLAVIADITEAKIAGENWYVSILGMPSGPDYAKSAIDTYTVEDKVDDYGMPMEDFDGNYSFSVPYADTNGIEIGLFGYKFGLGLLGDYSEDKGWKLEDNLKVSVFAETPEYDFSGLTVQAAATYSYSGFTEFKSNVPVYKPTFAEFGKTNAIGVAAKVGFANDTLSASVATDMGFNLEGDKFEDVFDMDVAANFNWSFLTLDAYYATEAKNGEGEVEVYTWDDASKSYKLEKDWGSKYTTDDVLSFQAKFDLNAFDVPVALTASVKDVLKTVELGVKAEVTAVENLTITASAGYVVNTIDAYDKDLNKNAKDDDIFLGQWKFGLDAEYDFGFAKVAAGVSAKNVGAGWASDYFENPSQATMMAVMTKAVSDFTIGNDLMTNKKDISDIVNQVVLGMSASISTESIIPGAELKLAWENADDLLEVYKYNATAEKYNFGKITASCKIAF